jgi:hypothetical protein
MDSADIYAKTELGLHELKERHLNLSVPLRGLLIMVDGNRTVVDILEKAKALRLDESALQALEDGGLIAKKFSAPSTAEGEAVAAQRSEDDVQRFMRGQKMISDAINKHLGFRGYGLMMRLQKTANIRDLHDLLREVAAALVKRVGIETATPIVASIEALIDPRK